jgi:dTDP-4-amino-4,6-dideoxygalactose transaminase
VPLHSSEFGQKVGRFSEDDDFTTKESARLVRLPLFHSITAQEIDLVVQEINSFYQLV